MVGGGKEKSLDSACYCVAIWAHLVSGLELSFGGMMLGPVFIKLTLMHVAVVHSAVVFGFVFSTK